MNHVASLTPEPKPLELRYAALSALGAAPGPSGAELARRSFVRPQTMNVILTNLETAGLVVRRPHPKHGRVLQTYLTEMGEDSVAKAHGLVEAVEGRMLDGLRQDDWRRLSEALRSCADALEGGSECAAAGAKDGLNAKVAGAHSSPS